MRTIEAYRVKSGTRDTTRVELDHGLCAIFPITCTNRSAIRRICGRFANARCDPPGNADEAAYNQTVSRASIIAHSTRRVTEPYAHALIARNYPATQYTYTYMCDAVRGM